MYYTQREIWLTVYGHEWYWSHISQRLDDGKQKAWAKHCMPLLHQFYALHKDEMPSFPMFKMWFDAVLYLGCPIDYSRPHARIWLRHWKDRERAVFAFLSRRDDEQRVRRGRRWYRRYGGKWRKEWEPDEDTWQKKKEAREKKAEWRRKLGKDRDSRESQYRRRSPGRGYKRARSTSHRAWVSREIRRENYDVFFPKEREVFFDYNVWS